RTSTEAAISRGLPASVAPRARRSSTGTRLRCPMTTSALPFSRMFFAMPWPMRPTPMKPTFILNPPFPRYMQSVRGGQAAPHAGQVPDASDAAKVECAATRLRAMDAVGAADRAVGRALFLRGDRQPLHAHLVAGHTVRSLSENLVRLGEPGGELPA